MDDVLKWAALGFAVGGWAMLTTIQIMLLRRALRDLAHRFDAFLAECAQLGIVFSERVHGRDRNTSGLLGRPPGGIFGTGAGV